MVQTVLANICKAARAWLIRSNFPKDLTLEAWGRHFFPLYFPLPCGKHHREIDGVLRDASKKRGRKIVLKAARGNAKSTFCTFLYPIHQACEYQPDPVNPMKFKGDRYIGLISDTEKQAKKYLAAIKHELEYNDTLAEIYPTACGVGPVWNETEIVMNNGVRIEVLGSGQPIRGRKELYKRFSLIVVDDPEGDDCAYSELIRDHTRDWFQRGVLNSGGPQTNFIAVGTNVHEECLVGFLANEPGWDSYNFQSILKWPSRMDLWDKWETILRDTTKRPDGLKPEARAQAFFEANKEAMLADFEVLWKEHEDEYELMMLRATGGHNAFDAEKQNEPVDASKCEWPRKQFFPDWIWVDSMPDPKNVQCSASYMDPSKGEKDKQGDFQALVDLQVDLDGLIFIDSWIGHEPLPNLCERFVERANTNESWVARCESNTFQELLLPDLEAAAKKLGIICPIQGQENHKNKDLRIRKYCGPYLTRGRIRLLRTSRGNQLLVDQITKFPTGGKKDGPDALAGGIQTLIEALGGRNAEDEELENPQ